MNITGCLPIPAALATRREPSARPAKAPSVAMIGTFPPRRCGIATFTSNLYDALLTTDPNLAVSVTAMKDTGARCLYPETVGFEARQHVLADYVEAAKRINDAGADIACLQHEYGIFGGSAGAHVLALIERLRCPVVTTLHTVLSEPDKDQRAVMMRLIAASARLVVMSQKARGLLTEIYGAPQRKIAIIPHGAPDQRMMGSAPFKRELGFAGRDVLLTFGLLSANKGIETMVRALPRISAACPDALYVVLGATHPHVAARDGEAYREGLLELAFKAGVADRLRFVNAYVDADMLLAYLNAADVYVTPYANEAQITSGTLAYAVALGKPVISTPFWHAQELLAHDCGMLAPFNDSGAFAEAAIALLRDGERRDEIRSNAYAAGRETIWARSAAAYLEAFARARSEARLVMQHPTVAAPGKPLPAARLATIERFTDACGILQHGAFAVPDRAHGYCLDDNARALMLMQRMAAAGFEKERTARLGAIYAAFVQHAWDGGLGRFRNFMSFERRWLEAEGSSDSFGRAVNALGVTAEIGADRDARAWAAALLDKVIVHAGGIGAAPRTHAFIVLGLCAFLRAHPTRDDLRLQLEASAGHLLARFETTTRDDWRWFESTLAYDNARLPEALIEAGRALDDRGLTRTGLAALDWLCAVQTAPSGQFRPVGTRSFGAAFEPPAAFDQQPLEAAATIDACASAFAMNGDRVWLREAWRAFEWFRGENDLALPLGRAALGACHDGLGAGGVNVNQGAESILSFQAAICAMQTLQRVVRGAPTAGRRQESPSSSVDRGRP
jgi:glycosyltransferase involved in cell wall biosynthesis